MEQLLRWGIANSDPNAPPPQPRTDLDPGIIDAILGKSDAELMKEALAVAVDEKRDEDERLQALDDFEMLIEQIDNANNLEKLKMWEPLQALLTSPTSSEAIQRQILWILGTAVQNNPAAQHSYLALSPLRALLSFLSPTVGSGKTRAKAVYALSGLLKHNSAAVKQMHDVDGWSVLRDALADSDISVRRKVAFLLNSLLIPNAPSQPSQTPQQSQQPANLQGPLQVPASTEGVVAAAAVSEQPATTQSTSSDPSLSTSTSSPASASTSTAVIAVPSQESTQPADAPVSQPQPVHANSHASMLSDPSSFSTSQPTVQALEQNGILSSLVSSLATPVPHGPNGESEGDADFEEKVLRALHTYTVGCQRPIEGDNRQALGDWLAVQSKKAGGDKGVAEKWGLTEDEVKELKEATA
ncbi:nucleotide exchange factors-like protein [Polyporus arcularius HHB13444]|uniref:Nucleotide exchange factors-like protein n=1 Tax=Polyporus arcularius HHB13444 TaxID=1314778 RepID=A0A5C3PR92_9APHY|nr:nucleotide exchange factors-like protein [Polyporus arcularius HHB13444]